MNSQTTLRRAFCAPVSHRHPVRRGNDDGHFGHAIKDGRHQGRRIGQSVAEALAPVR